MQVLHRLLQYGDASTTAKLNGDILLVVPRIGTISPWSSKATDIAAQCALPAVTRIERGVVYRVSGADAAKHWLDIVAVLHDRMTESVLGGLDEADGLFRHFPPRPLNSVAVMQRGRDALDEANAALGLALAADEIEYLLDHFRAIGRDHDVDVLPGERQLDEPLDCQTGLGKQEGMGHGPPCRSGRRYSLPRVLGDEPDHVLHGRAREEHATNPELIQQRDVGVRNDPAQHDEHVVQALRLEQFHDAWTDVQVRTRQDRQADDIRVLLQCRRHNLLRSLPEAGIDHLHAGIAERAGNDLRPTVVTIQPGLGDHHSDTLTHRPGSL